MEYKIESQKFEGPLDLLLHLIKQSDINIQDICIEDITHQYLNYINLMETMNLNIASEYLVMAAELIEIKSSALLPRISKTEDEFEEDPKEQLIKRLLEYEQYKDVTKNLKELEKFRKEIYTKEPSNLLEYNDFEENINYGVSLNDLLLALSKLIDENQTKKPLNTKVTNKEYNIQKKCYEIKKILRKNQRIEFKELFKEYSKETIVITFLAILSMSKKQEIEIEQEDNFNNIFLKEKVIFNEL
jgi:segregation and condensation protein A